MTRMEAICALARIARASEDRSEIDALVAGMKAIARDELHKRRYKASRVARGLPVWKAPEAVAASPSRAATGGDVGELPF